MAFFYFFFARSPNKFACPWVNNIFAITDTQKPLKDSKITKW